MTADQLRAEMKRRFEAMSMCEWCRLSGCDKSHVSAFVRGKKANPPSDMLAALNLRVDYVSIGRKLRQRNSASTPQKCSAFGNNPAQRNSTP